MNIEQILPPHGTDINAWMHHIQASIPRTIIVNIDELRLSALQIKQESGLNILCRLMADKIGGRKNAPVADEKLTIIKSLIEVK